MDRFIAALRKIIACSSLLLFIWSTPLYGNVWIDESFESGTAFSEDALDTYDFDPSTGPALTFSREEGTITDARAFRGVYAYRLEPGQSLAVTDGGYKNPSNGPIQYLQFAVSVSSVPAAGQRLAQFHWNWLINELIHSFYIDFISNGQSVEMIAGESLVASASGVIGLLQEDEWKYITLQMQKNTEDSTDIRTAQTLSRGMRFYVDSENPRLTVAFPGQAGRTDRSLDWDLSVESGVLYLDEFYWEGGLTNPGFESNGNLRPFHADSGCRPPFDYPVRLLSAARDTRYDSIFAPRNQGWLGADAAYSIPLTDDKILWLFGDTLVGILFDGSRQLTAFINNSIAIQDLSSGVPGEVTYYWNLHNGQARSFFPGDGLGGYFWPGVGVLLEGELFLFLSKIYPGTGGFGFMTTDTTLFRISNPLDDPSLWLMEQKDLGIGDNHFGINAALYVEEPYLYFLGFHDPQDSPFLRRAILARAFIQDILSGDILDSMEYWSVGDEWLDSPDQLATLFSPGVTETALQYDEKMGLYFATTYSAFSPEIYLTTAPALTGPWSTPACIYQIPEHQMDSRLISYAAKAHPELSENTGELILTYAVNTIGDFELLLNRSDIYYPRFIRVRLESQYDSGAVHWRLY